MSQRIVSVTQINEYIRATMDQDPVLNNIAVKGEISNYKLYPSGHHYFTLKDDGGALKCVMFRGNATRLRFRPENGMNIIAIGKISVFPRDGAYQLYCSTITLDGVGDLHAAFEQLKEKLSKEGLFDISHKKSLPQYPKTIGIITSAAGAAVHDMLRILRARYPLVRVVLLPVRVQGAEAPDEISAAISYANQYKLADLLIVGRGGGSIEDLWAFNDERVARAIYHSEIPVISAVGHEPDVTISDYVADLRAATPSNAAELSVPDQDALRQILDRYSLSMETSLKKRVKAAREHLHLLSSSATMQSPLQYIDLRREKLGYIEHHLLAAQKQFVHQKRLRYITNAAKLDALSPLKVLSRGYTLTQLSNGDLLRSIDQTQIGECVNITLTDGVITASVTDIKENLYGK